MTLARRRFLRLAAAAAVLPSMPRLARAHDYPTGPVRIIVGFAPGGSGDIYSHVIGKWLSERLGRPFITEYRPGAGTNIATEAVVRATPDGHSLLLANTANAINATLYHKLNFNFIRDIAPVASVVSQPLVMLVHPSLPINSVPEFISYAKANPGKIAMASAGNGSMSHISGELFKMMADVDIVHVPYRGAAPALTDLLGGQTQVSFPALASAIEYIRAGQLRALAVTTASRADALPEIPTLSEFLPGYETTGWFGIGAPRKTPADIVDKLNKEANAGLDDPKMRARLAELGAVPMPMTPAQFGEFIAGETEKLAKVIKFSGARVT
jgi:tripartite-type tricarboxylate transporter receptor subunit TctC